MTVINKNHYTYIKCDENVYKNNNLTDIEKYYFVEIFTLNI